MGTDAAAGLGLMSLLVAVGFLLLVVWIILPFAVLGVKPLLRELIREQKKTNALLELATRKARDRAPGLPDQGR